MISRRTFLRRSAQIGVGVTSLTTLGIGYGLWETSQIRINRQTVSIPNLPQAFGGKTIAILADLHHGPFVGIEFIHEAVRITKSLAPDLVALVGDYAHKGVDAHNQLPPCLEALSALSAPLGVYAVPGNHDMPKGGQLYRDSIAATPLIDLTNRNRRISLDGEHLWLAGVDDLWWGKPNIEQALSGVPTGAAVVLLCHNPDFAEETPNSRVGLVLSGHTHGGQVYLPGLGCAWLPSRYGLKYRRGLVQAPASSVFVSRGLGEAGIPLRMNVPPEIVVLTLAS
jgi:uncharacterized protein